MNTLEFPRPSESVRPINDALERSILGAILLQPEHYAEAAEQLRAEDFSGDSHRRIFRTMATMARDNEPLDIVSVTESLIRSNHLEGVGGPEYVAGLLDGVPDRPNISHYIAKLKGQSNRNRLAVSLELALHRLSDGESTEEISAQILDRLLEVESAANHRTTYTAREFLPDVLRELEVQASSGGLVGSPSGIDPLDEITGGYRRGELAVLGALPGSGKSANATQTVIASAEAGYRVGVFSAEMSRFDVGRRLLAANTAVSANSIRHPNLIKKTEWLELAEGAARITEWPIWFDDRGSIHISQLLSKARLWIARNGVQLIVVDYLQLIRAEGHDRREQVSKVADSLRQLAKAENVAVLLVSQLRRPQDLNDAPTMIQLKESGDIEAHAHLVLLLHTPTSDSGQPTGEDFIIIGKNRNGVRGSIPVTFNTQKLKFYPRTGRREP